MMAATGPLDSSLRRARAGTSHASASGKRGRLGSYCRAPDASSETP